MHAEAAGGRDFAQAAALRRRGIVLLCVLLALASVFSDRLERSLGRGLFDSWQRLMPRERQAQNVVIVAIDEASLRAYGAWPWPRSLLARLIDGIAAAAPAAVGVDILFVEPDRYSPQSLAEIMPGLSDPVRRQLQELPDGDQLLGKALARGPFVIARAAASGGQAALPKGRIALFRLVGGDGIAGIDDYAGLLPGLPALEAGAAGQGMVTTPLENGVVRRLPLVESVGGQPVPSLAMAMLHLASAGVPIRVASDLRGVQEFGLGKLKLPVTRDGYVWLHFSATDARRYVSAKDVIEGRLAGEVLKGAQVLVGFAALGLQDLVATPLGETIYGVEVHAQLLESVFEGSLLRRAPDARIFELGFAGLAGLLLVMVVPVWPAARSWTLWGALVAAALLASWAAFRAGILIDSASAIALLSAVFAGASGMSLGETERQRRRLDAALAQQREAALRLDGEFEAARRVQLGMLPLPADLPADPRYQLAAAMVAAKQVGGDLYDFFLVDDHRLFVLIGDVSGKGLPASIFMALSKTLCKSLALRRGATPSQVLSVANVEIARDNPELLFITAVAALLDLDSGRLAWARAGHDAPYLLRRDGAPIERLAEGGGPPLCVVDGYDFADSQLQLAAGDTLVLLTDGVLEAQNPQGNLFGRSELDASLQRLRDAPDIDGIVRSLISGIADFAGGAEAADDATVVVLRWNGPAPPAISGR